MTPPIVRLIMQIARIPEEVAKIILGFVPVRRRLTVTTENHSGPGHGYMGSERERIRAGGRSSWGYLQ